MSTLASRCGAFSAAVAGDEVMSLSLPLDTFDHVVRMGTCGAHAIV